MARNYDDDWIFFIYLTTLLSHRACARVLLFFHSLSAPTSINARRRPAEYITSAECGIHLHTEIDWAGAELPHGNHRPAHPTTPHCGRRPSRPRVTCSCPISAGQYAGQHRHGRRARDVGRHLQRYCGWGGLLYQEPRAQRPENHIAALPQHRTR